MDGYISDPAFRELVPEVVWQKAEYIRQAGNVAVHGTKTPASEKALDVLRELYHVLYWTGRTYLRKGAERLQGKTFDESLVPNVEPATHPSQRPGPGGPEGPAGCGGGGPQGDRERTGSGA